MKNISRPFNYSFLLLLGIALFNSCKNNSTKPMVSFYEVRLICHADTTIACATRVKTFFVETSKHNSIKEAEINRGGTAIAIFWEPIVNSMASADDTLTPIFTNNRITAKLIKDSTNIKELLKGLDEKGKWYSRNEIDQLSLDEAQAITSKGIAIAKERGLLNSGQEDSLKIGVKDFYDQELLNIKTYHELVDSDIRNKADEKLYKVITKYTEQKKAAIILEIFNQLNKWIVIYS